MDPSHPHPTAQAAAQTADGASDDLAERLHQHRRLGILHAVGENRILHLALPAGIQRLGPLLDQLQNPAFIHEDGELVRGDQGKEDRGAAPTTDTGRIALCPQQLVEFVRQVFRAEIAWFDQDPCRPRNKG